MNCDNIIADFAGLLESKQLQFRKTETEGVTYYYAENELYLIIDGRSIPSVFTLVRAKNPEVAISYLTNRVTVSQPDESPRLQKPPLGLVPRSVRDFERVSEILEALGRYNDAGKPVPREWLAELEEKIRKEEPAGVGGVFFAPDMQPKTQLVQEVTQ